MVVLLSLAVGVAAQWAGFFNEYVVNDDVRQQLFWMQRWVDPGLYPDTLLTSYSEAYVPWGVQGVYRLASLVISPLMFSKVLAVALLALLTGCVFAMVRRDADEVAGWMGVAVCLATPLFLYNISGGLARAFAAPLMALFLLFWQRCNFPALSLVLFAQAVFIPYIFAVCALAAGLGFVGSLVSLAPENKRLLTSLSCALPILAGVAMVLIWRHEMAASGFGPLVGMDALHGPEFAASGRFPLFPPLSVFGELIAPFGFIFPFRDGGVVAGVVAAVCVVLLALLGWVKSPRALSLPGLSMPLACLGLASLILYVAARLTMLKLFIPSRYLSYSWELVLTIGLAVLLGSACRRFLSRGPWLALFVAAVVCLGAVRLHGVSLYDYSGTRGISEAVRRTPKDALLFGHPSTLDNVMTFGRRNAYATYELAHPWNSGYWDKYRERLYDTFRQYYSDDPASLGKFLREKGITHVVVDREDFSERGLAEPRFFEPFDSFVLELVRGRKAFALPAGNGLDAVWHDERYALLKVR